MTLRNLVCRPVGASPTRSGVRPPGSVASLATEAVTRSAMRRYANVWAVAHAAPMIKMTKRSSEPQLADVSGKAS
jgi:hypothetical protein